MPTHDTHILLSWKFGILNYWYLFRVAVKDLFLSHHSESDHPVKNARTKYHIEKERILFDMG